MRDTQQAEGQQFGLSGGRLCLDFANTLSERPTPLPVELLRHFSDLVAWGRQATVLDDAGAARLKAQASQRPAQAESVLVRARVLREAIFAILYARTLGKPPADAYLETLNRELAEALAHSRLVPQGAEGGFGWRFVDEEQALDTLLWRVAQSAAELLTTPPELVAVRECAADDCAWLFLDTSKNHTRRWCDMRTCGNRAKARRHYVRKRERTALSS